MEATCIGHISENLKTLLLCLLEPVIFADVTSVTISSKHFGDICSVSNIVLSRMSKWFSVNKLALKVGKINRAKFVRNNAPSMH
jgi:hypothetical protein